MVLSSPPAPEYRLPALTVLIADQHAHFRRSLRLLCEINGGFRVVAEATTATELVALAAQLRPDAVLVDIHLTEWEETATLPLLLAAQPDLIAILLAFTWDAATLEQARRSGARAWLAKDCTESELFAALRTGRPPVPDAPPWGEGQLAAS
jgi:DNA-binding NarL/FixJ family response regulator